MPRNRRRRDGSARRGRERRISIRSELRAEPDLQKIARAVVALALAQAEKEAQAAGDAEQAVQPDPPPGQEPADD